MEAYKSVDLSQPIKQKKIINCYRLIDKKINPKNKHFLKHFLVRKMNETKRHNHFMRLALVEAYKSDEVFKVGACVVDENGKVVGTGHNVLLPNCTALYDSYVSRVYTKPMQYNCVNLAAESALNCAHKFENCTLYQNTFPTPQCIKEMVKKGVTGLVYYHDCREGYQDMYDSTTALESTQKRTLKVRRFYLEDEDTLTKCMREVVNADNRKYKPKPNSKKSERTSKSE